MQFCQDHWDRLRAKIEERGLSALVPDDGEKAAAAMTERLAGAPATVDNFDPLMGSMWAIVSNLADRFGAAVLLNDGCPLCEANKALVDHAAECTNPECTAGEGGDSGYDWMLDRAADDQVTEWQELGATG